MLNLARDGFTQQEVKDALHGKYAPIHMRFRYDLLDKNNNYIRTLTNVISGDVSCNSGNNIKRTARFTLEDDGKIDYLSDRIQPFVEVYVRSNRYDVKESTYFIQPNFPSKFRQLITVKKNGWVSFPLGVFLLSSPTKTDQNNMVIRDVEAYDGLIVLKEDKFTGRYTVTTGTNYVEAVITILQSAGIQRWNIESTDKSLDKDIEFEPGKEKLFAVNELLRQINYDGIKVDVNGYYTSSSYRSPAKRSAEYTYIDDDESVTLPGMTEEFDLSQVPNQFVVVRTNAEQEPLRSVYTNDNPDSPISTVSRGRAITDYREIDDIADQEALDGYAERIANSASQVFGNIRFQTGIMPFHDVDDVLQITYSKLGVSAKYSETAWSFPLVAGGTMEHELRRVVSV
ncbi:hypothetical protein HNQ94_000399 [Salirhabdus euzebyi]|uniref:Uncharacterized protein n=1 Tax=Salirhabdus euzebyi TaxID=394506 RepID=A0A841Q2Z0_9BACI|nr:hypothetical protein [Salirhabdus euzebyi]MBB6451978.1 hypothetical protein [Salirhabdus euzebyi]